MKFKSERKMAIISFQLLFEISLNQPHDQKTAKNLKNDKSYSCDDQKSGTTAPVTAELIR